MTTMKIFSELSRLCGCGAVLDFWRCMGRPIEEEELR
jgi:hypothetical protein